MYWTLDIVFFFIITFIPLLYVQAVRLPLFLLKAT